MLMTRAAALCRSAGYWPVAYPVAERLSRPADLGVDGLVVVADHGPAGAVAGLGGSRHRPGVVTAIGQDVG